MSFSSLVDEMVVMLNEAEPPSTDKRCIYKVPFVIRKHNEDAYTPNFVSIGPFHHGHPHPNPQLQNMESQKLIYFKDFLQRTNASLNNLVSYIDSILPDFKRCYSETLPFSHDELVKLILIDSGFIIELFWRCFEEKYLEPWLDNGIRTDLLLLENQLPFFVIENIYGSTNATKIHSFLKLTINYFKYFNKSELVCGNNNNNNNNSQCIIYVKSGVQTPVTTEKIRHFTDLIRIFHLQPPIESQTSSDNVRDNNSICIRHCTDLIRIFHLQHAIEETIHLLENQPNSDGIEEIIHLPSATQLLEAGVRFVNTESTCLLDLEFSGGVLKIPRLTVEDGTEILFRNMVALEQCHYPKESYITDYVVVLDFLINTGNDADILVRNEILTNLLGDSNSVAKLFNGLCKNVIQDDNSHFSILYKDLNVFCSNTWNKLKASLRRDYGKTPWQTAASVAGILLLFLTLLQSVCSVLQVVQAS